MIIHETIETAALNGWDAQEVTEPPTKAADACRQGRVQSAHFHMGSNLGVEIDPETTSDVLSDQAKFLNAGDCLAGISASVAEAEC